jgi:excisionase family DNA binding protein
VRDVREDSGSPQVQGPWLTLGEACRALCVDESTLRRWADSGHIRAFRTPGGHRRFAEPDIRALVQNSGRNGERYQEVGDLAISRIRRQLHQRPTRDASWINAFNESSKERLRPLGRRLAALAAEYLGKRTHRSGLLDDARSLGREYGHELASSGLTLAQAVEAFIFFRKSLDEATKQASQKRGLSAAEALSACEQVISLADQVLVGLTEAYEEDVSPVISKVAR